MRAETETCKNTSFNKHQEVQCSFIKFYTAVYSKHIIYYGVYLFTSKVNSGIFSSHGWINQNWCIILHLRFSKLFPNLL